MKKFYFILMATITSAAMFGANDKKTSTEINSQARQWMQSQPVKFLENKGQMIDMNGTLMPFVLFKAKVPGMDMYVTEKGITYLFIKTEAEDHKKDLPSIQKAMLQLKAESNKKKINTEWAEEKKQIEWTRVDMDLKGASIKKENITTEGVSTDFSQYFLAHCPQGITDVRKYEKIIVKEIYPGIDWILYNVEGKGFKYDFKVHPGANPKQIEMVYSSLSPLQLNKDGSIVISTKLGTISEQAPYSYIEETMEEVAAKFKIINQQYLRLSEEEYYQTILAFDMLLPKTSPVSTLIIDPQLVWATFYGGSTQDGPCSIDCDLGGNVFIAGYNYSFDLPVQDPGGGAYFQGTFAGGQSDAFILKFSNSGVLIWATYYGGSDDDGGQSITTDGSGNVFVTGYTKSTDFPVLSSPGAYFQGVFAGGGASGDAFILKFSNMSVRLWATYYGGSSEEWGFSICTDPSGNVYATGAALSADFPVLNLAGAYFGGTTGTAFIIKFDAVGALLWATCYEGTWWGQSICTDPAGNVFVTGDTDSPNLAVWDPGSGAYFQGTYGGGGNDAFILKFSNTGVRLWATYYGGNSTDGGIGYFTASTICTDFLGNVFITGQTDSPDLPVLNPGGGAYFQGIYAGSTGLGDIFIAKFDNSCKLLWATFYGGPGGEIPWSSNPNMVIDSCNSVYVSFSSYDDTPVKPFCSQGFYTPICAGAPDIFIVKFSNAGALLWATYFGGDGTDFRSAMALDNSGNLFIAGEWVDASSTSCPLTNPGGGAYYAGSPSGMDEGYIAKFIPILPGYSQAQINPTSCSTCNGSATVTVTCGTAPYNYVWSNAGTTLSSTNPSNTISNLCAGSYWVEITDGGCNRDTLYYTITSSGSSLTLNITQTNVLCKGGTGASATVAGQNGTPPYTYNWSSGAGTNATASGLGAGTYTVTVSDASGCSSTQTLSITEPSALTGTLSSTAATCNKKDGIATATATGGTVSYTYSWNPSAQTTQTATGLAAGNYTATIWDANGCSITQTVTVISSGNSTAANQTISICFGSSHTLPGGSVVNTTGTYTNTLISANGCDSIITTQLIVHPDPGELFIPNAFSPNGDGENDVLQLYYGNDLCIKTLHLVIYDRWGEEVFETTSINLGHSGWDGKYEGKTMHTQVLVYYLNATMIDGEEIIRKGNISLIK